MSFFGKVGAEKGSSSAFAGAALIALLAATPADATNGHILHAVGAPDSAMGGSTLAAPQDTLTPLFSNVGAMTQIPGTRIDVNLELIRSRRNVRSTLGGVTGKTQSDTDNGLIPAFGISHTPQESDTTFFLGALGISGFGSDYPQDDDNPVLRAQIANGQNTGGFGKVYSFYQLLRITGGVAYKLTPALSLGFSPVVNYATLELEPFPATRPDCTAQGVCAYPDATGGVPALGAGFLTGLHYRWNEQVTLGVGYTSPMWFTKFHWNSSVANPELASFDERRTLRFRLNAPQSVAFGVGLEPYETWLVTMSAKWVNFADTAGLDDEGFDANGKVRGLGWKNTWVAAIGTQWRPFPRLALRAGYNYCENPQKDPLTVFNIASPTLIQHHATGGLGFDVTEKIEANLAFYQAFSNTSQGSFVAPGIGEIPGSKVRNKLGEHSFLLQLSVKL